MDIQRLRNLTTGRLHTKMEDIYADIEMLTGKEGVMTHMLPNACRALEPHLRRVAPEARLWNGAYDVSHTGQIAVPQMTAEQRAEFWKRFGALPSPFARMAA
jgi:hypothetical protein